MWTDRFANLPILEQDFEDEDVAVVNTLKILPFSILSYMPIDVEYVDDKAMTISREAVEIVTKEDIHTVLMTLKEFETYMNSKF